jgi:hypothetical protein
MITKQEIIEILTSGNGVIVAREMRTACIVFDQLLRPLDVYIEQRWRSRCDLKTGGTIICNSETDIRHNDIRWLRIDWFVVVGQIHSRTLDIIRYHQTSIYNYDDWESAVIDQVRKVAK